MKKFPVIAMSLCLAVLSLARPAEAQTQTKRAEIAADRIEIMELGARFDNSLDAEEKAAFVSTFIADGSLIGFWGESKGPAQIGQAFDSMLATFARNRRHFVSNQQITVDGDKAKMFSYLVVFDRDTNTSIGTATFTDELVRQNGSWRFARRTLSADKNVQALIQSLQQQKK